MAGTCRRLGDFTAEADIMHALLATRADGLEGFSANSKEENEVMVTVSGALLGSHRQLFGIFGAPAKRSW